MVRTEGRNATSRRTEGRNADSELMIDVFSFVFRGGFRGLGVVFDSFGRLEHIELLRYNIRDSHNFW